MTTPESRLVRLETEMAAALKRLEVLADRYGPMRDTQVTHEERIGELRHDHRNMRMAIDECKRHAENIGRAAHDLVAQERQQRIQGDAEVEAKRIEALDKISRTLVENEEKRRRQFDTWFKRVGFAAWTVSSAVLIAYLVSLIT